MGFFGNTTFKEGEKLYYHNAEKGLEMMASAEKHMSASEMKDLAYKYHASGKETEYATWMEKAAKKKAE